MNGWIRLHRQLQENQFWIEKPFSRGQAWVDLLLLANYKRGHFRVRGITIPVERGQVGWSTVSLASRWGWSRAKAKRFFRDLENEGQIVQQTNRISSLLTVINYNLYQTDVTTDVTTERQQTLQQTDTNKKEKKDKKEKNTGVVRDALPTTQQQDGKPTEPCPADIARVFFSTRPERDRVAAEFSEKGYPLEWLQQEIQKFYVYWTEPTPNGKKHRWQLQKTFEVRRRLATWLMNTTKFSSSRPHASAR